MSLSQRRLAFEVLETRRVLSAVSIPVDLTGHPSDQVLVPVEIDDAADVRGVEIDINYDTALLDADNESVLAGTVWPEGSAEVVANVDDDAGSIVVWIFTAEGLDPGGGSLLQIQFTISSDAVVGDSTDVDLAEVVLNEGAIAVDPEPQPGPDSTDGLITFVGAEGNASVSGVVYADTNNNDQPDEFEGVPGVRIVLVNQDNGEQRETLTDAEGGYEFVDLPAGSYTIEEQQPAAFLDGGSNEISVDLADGESLADQNFRELGLRPEYVYNRLFTTLVMPVGSTDWVDAIEQIVDDAESDTAESQTLAEQATSEGSSEDALAAADTTTATEQAVAVEQSLVVDDPVVVGQPAATSAEAAQDDSGELAFNSVAGSSTESDSVAGSELEMLATEVSVFVPDDLTGQPSDQVLVPVEINDAEDVRGVEININYDTTLLDTDNASVLAGSVWPEGSTEVVANVDDSTGSIVAWVFTAEGLDPGGGSLLQIQFTISSDAVVGDSTDVDLAEVVLNEGAIAVDPEPQPGPDSTDGLITFVGAEGNAGISGVVYADTNENDQPDQFEGIPGVWILLFNEDNGEQREAFTDDEGGYEFVDLPAGFYTIEEQQPAAFLDGGSNEISVDLAVGESLADRNFRELGLRPEYVYNRLLTTLVMPVGSTKWSDAIEQIVDDAEGDSG